MCAPEVEGAEREFAFVAKRRCVVLQASAATHGMKVPETIGTRGIGNCLTARRYALDKQSPLLSRSSDKNTLLPPGESEKNILVSRLAQ